jgi:hypothetical protein
METADRAPSCSRMGSARPHEASVLLHLTMFTWYMQVFTHLMHEYGTTKTQFAFNMLAEYLL